MTHAVPIEDQITCVKRELGMRRGVYARRVANGQMKPDVAAREVRHMEAVLQTLEEVAAKERLL